MKMRKKQSVNPYLPSYEYIPDGEPHVFGDRIYIYGSHDRFNGADFCLNDYVCYSAPVSDFSDWRYEGVIYRKDQDPDNQKASESAAEQSERIAFPVRGAAAPEMIHENELNEPGIRSMYAPDVARGPDGRFYLYYCLADRPQIRVAVCDKPAGEYHFLGYVRHKEGDLLGNRERDLLQFDPGVFIDEDGEIYLYSGNTSLEDNSNTPLEETGHGIKQASQVMTLEADMLTLKTEPVTLLPGRGRSIGTGFEGHEFFEASSLRKRGKYYYLVYSSVNLHELCYAFSRHPNRGFRYGGTIVDIADIGYHGRRAEDGVNCLGNTHGGIECINGRWYVFYHRHSNRTQYSRQGCAEEICFDQYGRIAQVEVTSQGLNGGPLEGEGEYPACICCQLCIPGEAKYSLPSLMGTEYPYLTQDMKDIEPEENSDEPVQYIANITPGARVGYKYFDMKGVTQVTVTIRGKAEGRLLIGNNTNARPAGVIPVQINSREWVNVTGSGCFEKGIQPLYFRYEGTGTFDLRKIRLRSQQLSS